MAKICRIVLYCALLTISYGLEIVPRPKSDEGSLIWYNSTDPETTSYWINDLNEFLKPYAEPRKPETRFVHCEAGVPVEPESKEVCDVAIHDWHPCTAARGYAFNSSTRGPCVFLKFDNNKILGWQPGYYNSSTLPEQVPEFLRQRLNYEEEVGRSANVVWVSCEGEHPADIEHIGPINYYPMMGFDGQYFPFVDAQGYLAPLVGIYFERPQRGVLINIKCTAWAKELNGGELDDQGSVHFQLLIDS